MSSLDDIDKRLRASEQAVNGKFSDRIKIVESYKPWVIALGALGAAVIAGARLTSDPTAAILTAVGLTLAFSSAVAAGFLDYRKLEIGTELRTAETLAAEAVDEGRRIETELSIGVEAARSALKNEREAAIARAEHRQSLLDALRFMNEAAERCSLATPITTVIESMLDSGMTAVQDALGFSEREHWTLSVFVCTKRGRSLVMQRAVARWWDRAEELKPPRTWKKGEGYTGYAWTNKCEVIESDTALEEPLRRYNVPTDKTRPGDSEHYRSVACILIRAGDGPNPWGAITATSNKIGRFERNPTDIRSLNVDVLRQIASLIAVQVSVRNPA